MNAELISSEREHPRAAGPARLPVVGVSACRKMIDPHPFHVVGEKYLTAVRGAAGCVPLLIPALGERMERETLLGLFDGLLFTGSHSNVEPRRYGGRLVKADTLADPQRDATTLPLIRDAVAAGMPVLAICRGYQEMNVAFGGVLHQHVEEQTGLADHRENPSLPLDERYAPVHPVYFTPGGLLASLLGEEHGEDSAQVNSLHGQGVRQLGERLVVEATAPDGLVEAFRVGDAPGFTLAVQWHPEWRALTHPLYAAIFRAFGAACAAYREQRQAVPA